MSKPWTEFAFPLPPAVAGFGERVRLERIYHVTHTSSALRILDDRAVGKRLISDESVLNKTRAAVVWLSPDYWNDGFRYGNVRFAYDFVDIILKRKIYWVEVIRYGTPACRFLVSERDVSHLPVVPYDPANDDGPLRVVDGEWWRHGRVTTEIMLDDDLQLADCRSVDFVKHHPRQCALPGGGCRDKGTSGNDAAARVVAYILARDIDCVDHALKVAEPKERLSDATEQGLSWIMLRLGAISSKLEGPLKSEESTNAALRAALLQVAVGDTAGAKRTAHLIGSDDLVRKRLAQIILDRFGFSSDTLAE
jgi:hypothetical protein